jgi:hypothetical protein
MELKGYKFGNYFAQHWNNLSEAKKWEIAQILEMEIAEIEEIILKYLR